ncbi:MAG TPA: hypothetical protein VKK30_03575, partial [Actinomycetota bacterium]|nr:hypothetical protein [Actinomycetota bacterium]
MSLRARLLLSSVVLVAAGLAAASVVTYRLVSSSLLHRIDDELRSSPRLAAHQLSFSLGGGPGGGPDDGTGLPSGTYVAFRNSSGIIVSFRCLPFDCSAPAPALPSKLPVWSGSAVQGYKLFTAAASGGGQPRYRVYAAPALENPQSPSPVQGTLIVAIPLTETTKTLHNLLAVEGLVGLAVLLALAGLAWWLVRVGLRPLEGI